MPLRSKETDFDSSRMYKSVVRQQGKEIKTVPHLLGIHQHVIAVKQMPYPERVSFGSIVAVICDQSGPTILLYPRGQPLHNDTSLRTHFHGSWMVTGQTAAGQELVGQYQPTPHASPSPCAVQRAQSTQVSISITRSNNFLDGSQFG
ncbi:hypothetical protein EK904_010563 [Melospiza melodia maxima]|nr:hypothetical protein EK904_010563 [Melospiza melodia maxima]